MQRLVILWWSLALVACAGSSAVSMRGGEPLPHAVRGVAMAPSSSPLGAVLAVELSRRGLHVVDVTQAAGQGDAGVVRGGPLSMRDLEALRARGVDAVISVAATSGYDGSAHNAVVRVSSTHTGAVLGGVSWQNGWGGMPGSIADRVQRRGLVDVARELADALMPQLK